VDLPALHERERDLREWPILLPDGDVTWRGVVDRLYLVDGRWYLDDYKADRTLRPERYLVQLACYAEAVGRVLDVRPTVRLVGLRQGIVLDVEHDRLDAAWRERPATSVRDRLPTS
jgi:ATP-dependent exoDNAse (exonuclease V) beta subunit